MRTKEGRKTKVRGKETDSSCRGLLPVPGCKFVGEIFEKYPEVKSVSWDQYESGNHFYAEPWSVHVNGKPVIGAEKMSAEEREAGWELVDLMLLACGEEAGSGTLDYTTPVAVNTGNLLRALFGSNVIVKLNRDGSIEREPSWGRVCDQDMAERQAEEEAARKTFQEHVSGCQQCTSALDNGQEVMHVDRMCEPGRKLAEPFELGEFTGQKLWEAIQPDEPETPEREKQLEAVFRVVSKEVSDWQRGYLKECDRIGAKKVNAKLVTMANTAA